MAEPGPSRVSEAKLRANRRNAKKSTGPRTPEGKARSRRNALKNGVIARCGPLFDDGHPEDVALFHEVLDELRETHRPVEPYQERLIRRAALCRVRIARAMRLETLWAAQHWRELREAALRQAEQKLAELHRPFAAARQAGDGAELTQLRAQRAAVKRTLQSELGDADLGGALPEPDRIDAIIRYESSAYREERFIARQLECLVGGRKDLGSPYVALTAGSNGGSL